jgi:hypothetical protein
MRARMTAIAAAALALAGCGGSDHAASTVTLTPAAETKTVTVTVTPPPPPGPKTAIETNGTFVVNTDIVPGTYRTVGKDACYWARLRSLNTSDVIDNNISDGPQVVGILPTDAAFITKNCGPWHRVG